MGKAAPEQQPVAHGFHVRQNRRTRSGEAADRLEKRVGIGGNLPAEPEGQRPHRRQQHPRQGHNDVALPIEERMAAGPGQQRKQSADHRRRGHGGQHRPGAALVIQHRYQQRQGQQPRLHQQNLARRMENDAIVHSLYPQCLPEGIRGQAHKTSGFAGGLGFGCQFIRLRPEPWPRQWPSPGPQRGNPRSGRS